jgi:hypothetical protein
MSFTRGTAKTTTATTPAPAAKAAAATTGGGKTYPTHDLLVKTSKEGQMEKISGLFANEAKNGGKYLSVSIKEDITIPAGSVLYVFESKPKN